MSSFNINWKKIHLNWDRMWHVTSSSHLQNNKSELASKTLKCQFLCDSSCESGDSTAATLFSIEHYCKSESLKKLTAGLFFFFFFSFIYHVLIHPHTLTIQHQTQIKSGLSSTAGIWDPAQVHHGVSLYEHRGYDWKQKRIKGQTSESGTVTVLDTSKYWYLILINANPKSVLW